jgi:undecaprenyl-diphosphatase
MIDWIQSHPQGVLIAIALTAFIESFALIGVIVPGVVMLFSLAAVASNLDIPVIWVLLAAALGATCGDLGSYFLGYRLRHRLYENPWFKRHEEWLRHGIWFFQRWGWLSVVIGRFIGPIRPVVPLIAGSLEMPARVFVSVNLLTVLVWAPAYMLPGYLTGEASYLVATQSLAVRTLALLLLSAVAILVAVLAIYHHLHPHHPRMARWLPFTERIPATLPAAQLLLAGVAIIGFFATTLSRPWALDVLLAEQVGVWRDTAIDSVVIGITLIGDPAILVLTGLVVLLWFLLNGQWQRASIMLIASLIMLWIIPFLKSFFAIARPDWVAILPSGLAYPSGHASGFALYIGLLTGFANQMRPTMNHWHLYLPGGLAMLTMAVSRVWLGVHWLSDVVAGLCVALLIAAIANAAYRLTGRPRAGFGNTTPLWCLVLTTFVAYLIIAWPGAIEAYRLG